MDFLRKNALVIAVAVMAVILLGWWATAARAADKGGPIGSTEEIADVVKKFKPYIGVHVGAAAAYTDATASIFKDGGFDAAWLAGGSLGFTSRIGSGPWFWGLETSAERRMTTSDSTALSAFFTGGDLKYTVGVDGVLGANLSDRTKGYAKFGYRWGWQDDIVLFAVKSYNMPSVAGPEIGLGISHNISKNLVWDLNVMAWFPGSETVALAPGLKANFDSTDIAARTGFKFEF